MNRRTAKLDACFAGAVVSLFAALALGRVELVALACPLAVALAFASTDEVPDLTDVHAELSDPSLVEGEETTLVVTAEATAAGELELGVPLPSGLEVVTGDPRIALSLSEGDAVRHEMRLVANHWGNYELGTIALRVSAPGHMVVMDRVVHNDIRLKVYPAFDRIQRGITPADTHLFSGDYVSRLIGDAIEFAQVRPFTHGDSVRRVNWRVTSRRNELHVNLTHAERDADVLIFLDTFTDAAVADRTTLDRTVRGAAAIAQHHLRHNDRVGLIGFGAISRWLTSSMDRTQIYRIADFLLEVQELFSYAWKDINQLPPGTLPAGSIVIALSPMIDDRSVGALADISARGFTLVVVDTLDEGAVVPGSNPAEQTAHRLWRMQRAMARDSFAQLGVVVVGWGAGEGIEAALARAPRRRTGAVK